MKKIIQWTVAMAACGLLALDASGYIHARGARRNASGGISRASRGAFRGPNGGGGIRGRSLVTDGQGNATRRSGAAYRAPNGATAGQHATIHVSSDGTVTRQSAASASGAKGTAQTSGYFQRNPDGTASATRNTSATAANGNTYQGNTTWTKGSGVQHTGSCADASGNPIACPGK